MKSLIIDTRTTMNKGKKIVGLPPESEMTGIICRIPMKRK
jgi:hypothetical protein